MTSPDVKRSCSGIPPGMRDAVIVTDQYRPSRPGGNSMRFVVESASRAWGDDLKAAFDEEYSEVFEGFSPAEETNVE